MSKVIYVCQRYPVVDPFLESRLDFISKRIVPDNIVSNEPIKKEGGGIHYRVINPSKIIETCDLSVLIGKAATGSCDWWQPGSENPDGSYALFRSNGDEVEIITDVVASRTIWYYKSEEIFIASSSQRAMVMLMESFSFNADVIPWMLSSGSLGPFNSWDSRINLVPPDSTLTLNRCDWKLSISTIPVVFSSKQRTDEEHEKDLSIAIQETFDKLNLDYSLWTLLLSGGYDSRAILCFLKKLEKGILKLKAITWGLKNSLFEKNNDAFIAKKLADHYTVPHLFYHTDVGGESIEKILHRYLLCGEGRIDHLGGYMDGFEIWKSLYEDQVKGIIRGDESFGGRLVDTPLNVRSRIGIPLCSDYSNLKNYVEFGIPEHRLPPELMQQESETLEVWRDRIYTQFRMPVILAALNDLKLSYVEIVNPFLSRRIIYQVRQLPDRLRTKKALFKKIVDSISPDIEYATISAIQSKGDLLSKPQIIELITTELNSEPASLIFPEKFIQYVLKNTSVRTTSKSSKSLKSVLASFVPDWKWMRKGAKSIAPQQVIDFNIIAFRMYLTIKMNQMLRADALALKRDMQVDSKIS